MVATTSKQCPADTRQPQQQPLADDRSPRKLQTPRGIEKVHLGCACRTFGAAPTLMMEITPEHLSRERASHAHSCSTCFFRAGTGAGARASRGHRLTCPRMERSRSSLQGIISTMQTSRLFTPCSNCNSIARSRELICRVGVDQPPAAKARKLDTRTHARSWIPAQKKRSTPLFYRSATTDVSSLVSW